MRGDRDVCVPCDRWRTVATQDKVNLSRSMDRNEQVKVEQEAILAELTNNDQNRQMGAELSLLQALGNIYSGRLRGKHFRINTPALGHRKFRCYRRACMDLQSMSIHSNKSMHPQRNLSFDYGKVSSYYAPFDSPGLEVSLV